MSFSFLKLSLVTGLNLNNLSTLFCAYTYNTAAWVLQREIHCVILFCGASLICLPFFFFFFFSFLKKKKFSFLAAVVAAESDAMPGQIPTPSVTAGSLPSLGLLAGISATTLTDKLKFSDFQEFGTMLSPLHFLNSLGKRPLVIKTEVRTLMMVVCCQGIWAALFET